MFRGTWKRMAKYKEKIARATSKRRTSNYRVHWNGEQKSQRTAAKLKPNYLLFLCQHRARKLHSIGHAHDAQNSMRREHSSRAFIECEKTHRNRKATRTKIPPGNEMYATPKWRNGKCFLWLEKYSKWHENNYASTHWQKPAIDFRMHGKKRFSKSKNWCKKKKNWNRLNSHSKHLTQLMLCSIKIVRIICLFSRSSFWHEINERKVWRKAKTSTRLPFISGNHIHILSRK